MSRAAEQLGWMNKIESSWEEFLSWIRIKHSIHPADSLAPEFSEFVIISSKIKLRCIHINPDQIRKSKVLEFQKDQSKTSRSKRNSMNEEYWFTKWGKPVRFSNCNCSFRKSARLSRVSNIIDKPPQLRAKICSIPPHERVENYVESLVRNSIFDALQELYVAKSKNNKLLGQVNLAFESSEEVNITKKYGNAKTEYNNINNKLMKEGGITLGRELENSLSGNHTSEFVRCRHKEENIKKPLVILFHGIGASSDIWWRVIHSLVVRGHEIVAPDMLGHGFSSAPDREKSYLFKNLLLHALAIFDYYVSVDENRKCILIGHSYGCSFATAVYHHRMQQISQIILISGGGPTPLAPPVEHDELINSEIIQALIQPLIFCGVNRSLFYSSRGKFFDVCGETVGIPNHILHFVKMGQDWPEGDATFHRRIIIPTLLVHGLQDKQITLVQECEMERTIPRSFLELIPNAGHMSMLEAPDQLAHMILCFLDYWS